MKHKKRRNSKRVTRVKKKMEEKQEEDKEKVADNKNRIRKGCRRDVMRRGS